MATTLCCSAQAVHRLRCSLFVTRLLLLLPSGASSRSCSSAGSSGRHLFLLTLARGPAVLGSAAEPAVDTAFLLNGVRCRPGAATATPGTARDGRCGAGAQSRRVHLESRPRRDPVLHSFSPSHQGGYPAARRYLRRGSAAPPRAPGTDGRGAPPPARPELGAGRGRVPLGSQGTATPLHAPAGESPAHRRALPPLRLRPRGLASGAGSLRACLAGKRREPGAEDVRRGGGSGA